jgi:hypothetical protein
MSMVAVLKSITPGELERTLADPAAIGDFFSFGGSMNLLARLKRSDRHDEDGDPPDFAGKILVICK